MRNAFSTFLIIAGFVILVMALFLLWKRNDPGRLQFDNENVPVSEASDELALPVGIVIESLQLKLPIVPASKNGEAWETTAEGVSYLTLSPRPGEKGNSILYGHNWGSILGRLYQVRPGERIKIYYSDGEVMEFEVSYLSEVTPQDTSILNSSEDARITLYTCSGFFDQKRFVVTAVLV